MTNSPSSTLMISQGQQRPILSSLGSSTETLSLTDFTHGLTLIKQSKEQLKTIRRSKKILELDHNLKDCGSWITMYCSECSWEPEKENDKHNIHVSCKIRICNKPHCVNLRYKDTRMRLEKYLRQILNLQLIVLTFEYQKIEVNTKKDIEKKFWKRVKRFSEMLNKLYGANKFLVNIDVIKKPHGKWHIHFNLIFDCDKFIHVNIIRQFWKERLKIKRASSKKRRKAIEDYFLKRVVTVNPRSKKGEHIPITTEEYYDLFYKSRFFRNYFWGNVKLPILVDSGNILISENLFCPRCGHKLIPKSYLFPKPDPPDSLSNQQNHELYDFCIDKGSGSY